MSSDSRAFSGPLNYARSEKARYEELRSTLDPQSTLYAIYTERIAFEDAFINDYPAPSRQDMDNG